MGTGYIKIHRSIEDWEWADDSVMFYFWVRILIKANREDKQWRGVTVKRGSLATTVSTLSRELKLSVKQVRTCIERLIKGKEITVNTANNYTHITICKYDDYQLPGANERQIKGKCEDKSAATTKEEYNTSDTKVSSYSIQEERKKEVDTDVSPQKTSRNYIDFNRVVEMWNSYIDRCPKVRGITDVRKEKIRLRVGEMGGWDSAQETLADCFRKINASDFCTGTSGKWTATFDWFFSNGQNWIKVLEGNYDNKRPASRIEQYADVSRGAKDLLSTMYYGTSNERTTDRFADTPDEQ